MSDELDDQEYLERIRNFDGNALDSLRTKYTSYGINYLKKKEAITFEEAKDICYHVFANIWAGLTRQTIGEIDHFEGYFFRAIQNRWTKINTKEASFDKNDYREYVEGNNQRFPAIEYGKIEKARGTLEKMKLSDKRCAKFLTLYYVEELKHEGIRKILNLKNRFSSKSTKARCMKKFKELFLS